MKGRAVYLTEKDISLLWEALDILELDYLDAMDGYHPEFETLDRLKSKLSKREGST